MRDCSGSAPPAVRLHHAEADRLDSLVSYAVLDTVPEASFDELTALAAGVCSTPLAAISLVDADRQWALSRHGELSVETGRDISFCSDAVAADSILVVPDARIHPRYQDNPLVTGGPGIRAYVGVPLVGRDGLPLGTLCVLDSRPRCFSLAQITALSGLARQVMSLLEQRRRDRTDGLSDGRLAREARDPRRIRSALEKGELAPWFQPVVDLGTGRPYGLEALLRWRLPGRGVLLPAAFLPAVEAGALVVPVGRAVLASALAELVTLRCRGIHLEGGVAVNVASGQLARPGLAAGVLAALDEHGVPAGQLALEITESTALPDPGLAASELGTLREAGVRIVLDDFGVGWSNLSRVIELPLDGLKLDRSIAGSVAVDRRAAAMVRATMTLAGDLGLDVIAEGVEDQEGRSRLWEAGCRWAQGWLFAGATPSANLPAVLNRLSDRSSPATRYARPA